MLSVWKVRYSGRLECRTFYEAPSSVISFVYGGRTMEVHFILRLLSITLAYGLPKPSIIDLPAAQQEVEVPQSLRLCGGMCPSSELCRTRAYVALAETTHSKI